MSSRLFQTVREKYGLCYSVYTFSAQHADTGVLGIYTALGRETENRALLLIKEELMRLAQDGVAPAELELAREQLKAGLIMSLESTNSRMGRLAKGELFYGGVLSPDELIQNYDSVSKEDILLLARQLISKEYLSFAAVGKVKPSSYYRELLI
jgi:predicted Zn-dependent peptidase